MKPSLPSLSSVQFLPCLFLCLLSGASHAQEAKVRSSLPQKDSPWVGERIPLVVELLVPGYFAGTAAFDLPDPPGMVLIPPISTPVVSSEEIEGVSYSVQRHELSVFPRRAGEQTIPPFAVRFAFKRLPLDKDSLPASGKTEALHFTAKFPPGAEHLGSIISARQLTAEESWNPEPGKTEIKAGDAFTRTITFSAPEVPAMAFPPFPAGKIDGLGIYPKAPEVLDKSDRGELTGKRRDSVTYVCQRAGEFTIPATRLTWYDLDAQALQTIDFRARVLKVAPNPAMAAAAAAAAAESTPAPHSKSLIRTVLTIIVLAVLAFIAEKWQIRKKLAKALSVFRPVRLQPLNPASAPPQRHNQPL